MPRVTPPRSAHLPPAPDRSASVLLAVTGESPAILTETIWALAREKPAVIPARVVVVTTTVGADRLERELLAPSPRFGGRSPWQTLRDELLGDRADAADLLVLEPARIITGRAGRDGRARALDDLRTREDNAAAADFILEEVRRITANPDTRLVASIAGGRKTMGALLYAAMTLVGRETDRLTHVLVNAPFDQRLDPPFFFPTRKSTAHTLRARDGGDSLHRSSAAQIELADVPFVPLRNAFSELRRPAGGFAGLVARYSRELHELAEPPLVTFDEARVAVCFDGRPVTLENPAQLTIVALLFDVQDDLRVTRIAFGDFAEIVRSAVAGSFKLSGHDQKGAAAIAERIRRRSPPATLPAWLRYLDGHAVSRAMSILRERVVPVCPAWRPAARTLLLPPFRLGPDRCGDDRPA